MRIEESKITPGMWFIKDDKFSRGEKIVKVLYDKEKAIIKMRQLSRLKKQSYLKRNHNDDTRRIR